VIHIPCLYILLTCLCLIVPTNLCRDVGSRIQSLSKSVRKVEAQAAGLSS
jgi:hypothetical protein